MSLVFVMFFWGAIGAAVLASLGNEAMSDLLPRDVEVVYGPMISAPVIEETAKGLALLAAFLVSRWAGRRYNLFEFDGPTDGIVYGAAIGIGFAFTEDIYYFFRDVQESGDLGSALQVYIDRRDFFGPAMLRHGVWTATFGALLGLATWSPSLRGRIGWPALGLLLAMIGHAANNGLINVWLSIEYGFETTYDYLAGFVPVDLAGDMADTAERAEDVLQVFSWVSLAAFFAVIAFWLYKQRQIIELQLAGERRRRVLTADELALAPRFLSRSRRYLGLIRDGRVEEARLTARLYRELADLAFAKHRCERGALDQESVKRRRGRIRGLRRELDAVRPD